MQFCDNGYFGFCFLSQLLKRIARYILHTISLILLFLKVGGGEAIFTDFLHICEVLSKSRKVSMQFCDFSNYFRFHILS